MRQPKCKQLAFGKCKLHLRLCGRDVFFPASLFCRVFFCIIHRMNRFNWPGGECLPSRNRLYTLNVFPFHSKAQYSLESLENWIPCRKWHDDVNVGDQTMDLKKCPAHCTEICLHAAERQFVAFKSHKIPYQYCMILIIQYVIHVLFDLGELAQVVCIDTCLIDGV